MYDFSLYSLNRGTYCDSLGLCRSPQLQWSPLFCAPQSFVGLQPQSNSSQMMDMFMLMCLMKRMNSNEGGALSQGTSQTSESSVSQQIAKVPVTPSPVVTQTLVTTVTPPATQVTSEAKKETPKIGESSSAEAASMEKAKEFEVYIANKQNYDDALADKPVADFTYVEPLKGNTGDEKRQDYATKVVSFSQADNQLADQNGDGKIDFDEYNSRETASYEKMFGKIEDKDKKALEEARRAVFKNMDLNNDGVIDDKENAAAIAMIDNNDGQIDGKISYKGYIAASALLGEKDGKSKLQTFYDDMFKQ